MNPWDLLGWIAVGAVALFAALIVWAFAYVIYCAMTGKPNPFVDKEQDK